MSGFETILYATQDGHARITLNRPEKLNALSFVMQAELSAALWEADNDRSVHCVILEGAGRAFCANGGQRVATVLCYLNDVPEGGSTAFK